MTDPAKCPLCPRVLKDDRPLCSNHLRKVGDSLLERYFGVRRSARRTDVRSGTNERAEARLIGITNQMILSATAYDQIRARGLRPVWNPLRESWDDPRERAEEIIGGWLKRHEFGRDATNDRNVVERIAADLYPIETP